MTGKDPLTTMTAGRDISRPDKAIANCSDDIDVVPVRINNFAWVLPRLLLFILAGVVCARPLHAQPTGGGFFIEASVDNATPYVGQAIIYAVELYAPARLPGNPRYVPPDYAGFWRDEPSEAIPRAETRDGQRYDVFTINTRLFPLRAGALTIEPGLMRIRPDGFNVQEIVGQAVTVTAQPLPPGAPDDFSGAVGAFELSAGLDRVSAAVGEPLTLTVTLSGLGNLEQVTTPELDLPAGWRAYDRPADFRPWDGTRPDEKTFTWLLVPGEAGDVTLDVLAWSYFDPATATYQTLRAPTLNVSIAPGVDDPNPANPSAPAANPGPNRLPIKPVPPSFAAPVIALDATFWLLWLLPPGVVLLAVVVTLVRGRTRRARAGGSLRQLRHLKHRADSTAIEAIITRYFADRLSLPPESVTADNLAALMTRHGVDERLRAHVIDCVQLAQAQQYANADISTDELLGRTRTLLRTLNQVWEPGT